MQQKVKLAMIALCYSPLLFAQSTTEQKIANGLDENAFTFTEAQLGEDDDMSQNVTTWSLVSSASLTSEV